ncbi:MAG: ComEC/Rec2 family competence protein, partial [Nitriliruptoraceae bacterium]
HHATVLLSGEQRVQIAAAGWLARSTETVRARVRAAAVRHAQDRRAGLLVGLVTGDTRLLDADDRAAMERTGTTHLTAVSGANVAIVAAAALALGRVLRLRPAAQRVVTATSIGWFAVLTRLEPSVLRAAGLAGVVLVIATRGTPRDTRHALAVVALVLLAIDPWLARSIGLVLSVAAALGIVTLAPRIRQRLRWVPRHVATVIAVTVGAQIAVTPVLLSAFETVAVASIPANLIAVPAAMGASVLAFVASAIAVVHPPTGGLVFAAAQWPAEVVLATARGFASVDAVVAVDDPAALLFAAGAIIWLLSPPGHRAARGGTLLVVIGVAWLVTLRIAGGLPPPELTV